MDVSQAHGVIRFLNVFLEQIAEKLYNKGYISYPRTETDCFENGFDLKNIIIRQVENPAWGDYAQG